MENIEDDIDLSTLSKPRVLEISGITLSYPGYSDISWFGKYNPFIKLILDERHTQMTEPKYFEGLNSQWENVALTFAVNLGYSKYL